MTTVAPTEVPPPALELPLDAFEVTADKRHMVAGKTSNSTTDFEVHGTPVIVPDDTFGSALQLNGQDTWVDVGPVVDALAGAATTDAFSVSLWVKPATAKPGNKTLISVGDAWHIDLEKSKPRFRVEALDPEKIQASVEKALKTFENLQAKAEKLENEAAEVAVEASVVESVAAAQENMLEAVSAQDGAEAARVDEIEVNLEEAQAKTEEVRKEADALLVKATKARKLADAKAKPIPAAPETISAVSKNTTLVKQSWMHIVGVYDGQGVRLYVDGLQAAELDLGATQSKIRYGQAAQLAIGVDVAKKQQFFHGQLARVQYFSDALTSEQVVSLRSADLSFRAAFQGRYPFDFELVDAETEARNVVYIADVGTRKARVTITNTASAPLSLNKPAGSAAALGADNHHFELRFRPDTFAVRQEDIPVVTVGKKERWQTVTAPSPDGLSTSVYMVWAGTKKKVLRPGDQVVFDLEYQSASGQMGSRGTNVVLGYRNLTWDTEDHLQIDVGGERICKVDVISRSGRESVPLQVGFVGTNRILNVNPITADESEATGSLRIRIRNNQLADPARLDSNQIRFRSIESQAGADADTATKFTVSFAVAGDAALTDNVRSGDTGNGMYLTWKTVLVAGDEVLVGEAKNLAVNRLGNKASWTFNPDVPALAPGDYFEIEMHGITTIAPSGPADIHIHYEDIPGYWDGQFTVTAEKSPLVYRDKQVGIGRYPKQDKLDGSLTVGRLKVERFVKLTHDSGGHWSIQNNRYEGGTNQMVFTIEKTPNAKPTTALRIYDSGDLQVHGTLHSEDLTVGKKGNVKISSNGTVEAKTVEVERFLTVKNQSNPSWEIRHNHFSGGTNRLAFNIGGKTAFQIEDDGRVKQLGGSWSGSDARLKTDIEDIVDPLEVLQQFRPRSFRWANSGRPDLGFVAQEVEEVMPTMVDASDDIRSVAYNQFIALAVGAIQQQQEQIDTLQAKLDAMEPSSDAR